jgi:hypothetical protein
LARAAFPIKLNDYFKGKMGNPPGSSHYLTPTRALGFSKCNNKIKSSKFKQTT